MIVAKMKKLNYPRDMIRHLRKLGIRPYDKIIHDQKKAWLIENFSHGADEYPVNVSRLMRNLVWQNRERIVSGEKPPLKELIRTFWYMYIKPTLSRAESLSDDPDDQYRQLVAVIADLVKDEKLMLYKDIGFRDENEANRTVGSNANIILFSEKVGHHDFLTDIQDKYKISILALGGKPSIMNIEYFVDHLKKERINLNRSFYIFSIVDFDPHGWIVKNSFLADLKFYGVKNIKLVDLIHPDMLTREEIEMSRYRIPQSKKDQYLNNRWLKEVKKKHYRNMKYLLAKKKTKKKIFHTLYGLEAEAVSTKRIEKKLEEVMVPILGKKEVYLKAWELDNLNNRIREYILFKLTGVYQ